MKKLLSIILVLAMVLSVSSVAYAESFIVKNETELKNAIVDGAEITLGDNIALSGTLTIPENTTVTLNLGGFELSYTTGVVGTTALIKNDGTLTINGPGKISNVATNPDTDWNPEGFPTYANNTITNCGTLTVNGGTITNGSTSGGACYAIDNNSGNRNAILTVTGGEVTATNYPAIRQFANSTTHENSVTIEGGTVSGTRAVWMQLPSSNAGDKQKASINVEGGTLTSTDTTYNLAIYASSSVANAENAVVNISGDTLNGNVMVSEAVGNSLNEDNLAITGGDFKGTYGFYDYSGNTPGIISGGTFSKDSYASYYLTDDAIAAEVTDADGTVYAVGKEAIEEAAADGGATIDITQASAGAALDNLPGGTTVKNNSNSAVTVNGQVLGEFGSVDPSYAPELTIPAPTPTQPPVQSGKNYWVKYNGGNSFSTNKKDVPTSVEIDGMPVPFSGDGKNFTVGCILDGADSITVRWNSTSVTTNFKPDANAFCGSVDIPKTGDMPFWAAVAAFFGF